MRLGRLVSLQTERRTLGELLDRYEREVLSTREGDSHDRKRQLDEWRKRLGSLRVVQVNPMRIAEVRTKLSEEGRSNATVNRYLAALSHALGVAAREWGWIDENPCAKVRSLTEPRGRVRFLSETERDNLLAAALDSPDDRLYPMVVLALSTGMRQGEILGLTWADVDFDRQTITLHQTKNGERRVVPLVEPALGLLRERARDSDGSPWVFRAPRSDKRPVFARRPWVNALEAAGVTDFRFHDLRHSAASYLAMNGASMMEIADVLGHKTMQMVKRYSHLSEAHTRGVVTSMNEAIFGRGRGLTTAGNV